MTTPRRLLAALAVCVGALALLTGAPTATARAVGDLCSVRGPVSARALPALESAGCPLVGRRVSEGRLSATVPPVGEGVAGAGVGRYGDESGLVVTNTGLAVHVSRAGEAGALPASRRRASPPACRDRAFALEGHRWASRLVYHVNLRAKPRRLNAGTVIAQVKAANANMRHGRNTCHRPRIRTPHSHYAGRSHVRAQISMAGPDCGKGDRTNIVAFGNLPGDLLGWTCTWYSLATGRTVGADIIMDNGRALVTTLPMSCKAKWDFEGALTHEWGHVYGLAHTGSGHDNLTMQHELTPCSTYARTLGLGDWLGMNQLYGHRH